jgi:hypothetical protein
MLLIYWLASRARDLKCVVRSGPWSVPRQILRSCAKITRQPPSDVRRQDGDGRDETYNGAAEPVPGHSHSALRTRVYGE